ncbi:protein kinase [Sorangium cellulosum]|uniref:Protein kinase n=1 Tax=Sorangium cellulosum TaxID=56 RepID=A0A2L0FBK1_SORCE|nr:AAA family ATPase [Sorangium cellulosum]AUX48934.1 protein kinase [Sorangium cellulosum]
MSAGDPFGWVGNTIADKLLIDAVAGEGAFGVVYRATHLGLEEQVAVKCLKLPAELAPDERLSLLDMFRREARLLHRLSRRTTGIVQALDVSAATSPGGQWTPYIVMEWLEGATLARHIEDRCASGRGPWPVDEALDLLAPAVSALALAHEERVSHRDVKPANLFLVGAGNSTTIKVVDFGIAKVIDASMPLSKALVDTRRAADVAQGGDAGATTRELAVSRTVHAFTPLYGAPEQFNPKLGATGPWTDVFALGLILLELASGQQPIDGNDWAELYAACVDPRRRPGFAALGVEVSPALEAVMARAVSVDPAARFQDARELEAALAAARRRAASPPSSLPSAAAGARPLPQRGERASHWAATEPARLARVAPPAGEYRVCTVLSVEVVAAGEGQAALDPEQELELREAFFELVCERADGLGGAVADRSGGAVTALFGAPRASDNDAERAVRAGLELAAASAASLDVDLPPGCRPALRVGISTGRLFVSGAAGSGAPLDASGEALQEAARLRQAALPGAVLIAQPTFRQVAGLFQVAPRGADPQSFRVLGPARGACAGSDFFGLETRFFGRAAEMQRLSESLETVVAEGRAMFVSVIGAGGIGRSRLLAEVRARALAQAEPCVVLSGACSSLARGASYHLAASLLRGHFRVHDDDPRDAVVRKLRSGVCGGADGGAPPSIVLEDALAEIAGVLCTPPPASVSSATAIAPDEGGADVKKRMSAAVAALLGAMAARATVLVLLDDIHWADDASLDLLDELVLRLSDAPLLVVGAARPELYERRPHWGEGKASHARLDLGPLSRRHIEDMARDRLRLAAGCSAEAIRALAERAEGNPLTLTETLHLLIDVGALERREGEPWILHEEKLAGLALPTTIQGIVQARLDRLDGEARAVLAQAAVIGRTFWKGAIDHLRGVAPEGGGSRTSDVLSRLRDQQIIRARDVSTFPDDSEYVFAEAATQEIAYETLSLKARRAMHRAVASWLDGVPSGRAAGPRGLGEVGAALAALHHDRGGDARSAALAYVRAAAHASALGQNAEALRHFERAREIHAAAAGDAAAAAGARGQLASAPDGPRANERRRFAWQERAALLLEAGDALRRAGRLDEAERAYGEARARILRVERRAAAPLDPSAPLLWDARVDFRLALALKVRGATAEARALVERAIALAGRGGAAAEVLPMAGLLAALHRRDGDLGACQAVALRSLRVCRTLPPADDRRREAASQLLLALGTVFYSRGRLVQAERCYRQAARAVDDRAHPGPLSFALNGVAAVLFAKGEIERARDVFARALALMERLGDLQAIASGHSNLAEVELRLARPHAALEHARRAVRLAEQAGAGADLPDTYRNLAEALLAAGRVGDAIESGCAALRLAEVGGGRVYLGEVALGLARICRVALHDPSTRPRAEAAVAQLTGSLAAHFQEGELARRADECRELLQASEQTSRAPDPGV